MKEPVWFSLRGKWWQVIRCVRLNKKWGDTEYPENVIRIDQRASGFPFLDTACHEWLHAAFPKLKEKEVLKLGTDLAAYIEALGYRKAD